MPSRRFAKGFKDYKSPGDPEKAAKAIVDCALMENAPMRLILGADSFASAEKKVDKVRTEMALMREVSCSVGL